MASIDVRKYKTGNAIPSYATKDLFDDTLILESLLTDTSGDTVLARDGTTELTTWYGIQQTYESSIAAKADYTATANYDLAGYAITDTTGAIHLANSTTTNMVTVNGAAALYALNVYGAVGAGRICLQEPSGGYPAIQFQTDSTGTRRALIRMNEDGTSGSALGFFTVSSDGATTAENMTLSNAGDLTITGGMTIADNLTVTGAYNFTQYTPSYYTATASTIAGHFAGVDTALNNKVATSTLTTTTNTLIEKIALANDQGLLQVGNKIYPRDPSTYVTVGDTIPETVDDIAITILRINDENTGKIEIYGMVSPVYGTITDIDSTSVTTENGTTELVSGGDFLGLRIAEGQEQAIGPNVVVYPRDPDAYLVTGDTLPSTFNTFTITHIRIKDSSTSAILTMRMKTAVSGTITDIGDDYVTTDGGTSVLVDVNSTDVGTITVTAQTITKATEITGTFTNTTITTSSNIIGNYVGSTTLTEGLILMFEITTAETGRWKIYNSTTADITLSADITLNYRVFS